MGIPMLKIRRSHDRPIFNMGIPILTVGELRSGVTELAKLFATASHQLLLQVRNDERDEINLRQMVNMTYHWLMYVIISSRNNIELCRTFRWEIATKKRQILTFEFKNLRNNRKKINNYELWQKLATVTVVYLQAFIHTVIWYTSVS